MSSKSLKQIQVTLHFISYLFYYSVYCFITFFSSKQQQQKKGSFINIPRGDKLSPFSRKFIPRGMDQEADSRKFWKGKNSNFMFFTYFSFDNTSNIIF